MAGRPTKYVPETVDKILEAVRLGAPLTHACNYAGVSFETFNEWRKRYPEFSEQLKEAEGHAVKGWLDKIETAASNGNWQAAAWKLERRYPGDFGRQEKITITSDDADRAIDEALEKHNLPKPDTFAGEPLTEGEM